jgi:hypothetical protein
MISCEPDDYNSIRNAVICGMSKERDEKGKEYIRQFTWEKAAKKVAQAYEYALQNGNNCAEPERSFPKRSHDNSSDVMEKVIKLVEQQRFKEALSVYEIQRPFLERTPGLVRIDELMEKVKVCADKF